MIAWEDDAKNALIDQIKTGGSIVQQEVRAIVAGEAQFARVGELLEGGAISMSRIGDVLRRVAQECYTASEADDGSEFGNGWGSACRVMGVIFQEAAKGADIAASQE